jgi:hypothetical protein
MIIKFTESLSIKTLKKIAKINGLKYIHKLNKSVIIDYLNLNKSVQCIQRHFRSKCMTDNICPISMEKLKYPFIVIKSNNTFHYYDFNTIVKYFLTTRDFRDPLTRECVKDEKIQYINRLIRYYYGSKTNKLLWTNSMIKMAEFRNILLNLNNLVSEVMNTDDLTIQNIFENINPRFIYHIQFMIDNHMNHVKEAIEMTVNTIKNHKCEKKIIIINTVTRIIELNQLSYLFPNYNEFFSV